MGIVVKQSFKNLIVSYLGVLIGFFNVTVLRPMFLRPAQIGLIEMLATYGNLLSSFFSFGFIQVITILFPKYKKKENFGGLFNGGLFVLGLGTICASLVLYFLIPLLQETSQNSSDIFSYVFLIIPWVFFNILFGFLDAFYRLDYDSFTGALLRETVLRCSITVVLVLFGLKLIEYEGFVVLYAVSFYIPGIVLMLLFSFKNKLSALIKGFDLTFFKEERKRTLSISSWSIIGAFGYILTVQIDKVMVDQMLGVDMVGIYASLVPYAILILIPSRALKRITTTLITEAWNTNDLKKIQEIYVKSSINQFLLGAVTFIVIWTSLEHVLSIAGKDFLEYKNVVFWVGLAYLTDMIMGVNQEIIGTSKKYRYNTYFVLILGVVTILTNFIFIEIYQVEGAAIATCISLVLINVLRYFFLRSTYSLKLFNSKTVLLFCVFVVTILIGTYLPSVDNHFLSLAYKSIVTAGLFFGLAYVLNISPDLNNKFRSLLPFK